MIRKQFLHRIGEKQYSVRLEMYLWKMLKSRFGVEKARRIIKQSMTLSVLYDKPLTQTVRHFVIRKLALSEVGEAEPEE
jgi:hypothetical protein